MLILFIRKKFKQTKFHSYFKKEKFQDVMNELKKRGHKFSIIPSHTMVQVVRAYENHLVAHSDYRKAGYPAGYTYL